MCTYFHAGTVNWQKNPPLSPFSHGRFLCWLQKRVPRQKGRKIYGASMNLQTSAVLTKVDMYPKGNLRLIHHSSLLYHNLLLLLGHGR
jgi:hypothetical protein